MKTSDRIVTFKINFKEAKAQQIEETQVLQANVLQAKCQESKNAARYITPFFYEKLVWKSRAKTCLIFWML